MAAKKPTTKTGTAAKSHKERLRPRKQTAAATAENAAERAIAAAEDKQSAENEQAQPWKVSRLLHVTVPLMTGEDVRAVQRALIAAGYHCGTNSKSGVYGRETAHAVRCFQSSRRLIVDGKAGRFTVAALGGVWESPQEPQQKETSL